MHVAIVMLGVPKGFQGSGIPLSVRAALETVLAAGHEATVISCFEAPAEQPFHERLTYRHVAWRVRVPGVVSMISDLVQARAMARELLRVGPGIDLVDVQEANIAPIVFRAAEAIGARKVYSIRQTALYGPRRFSWWLTPILRHYNLAAARMADLSLAMTETSRAAYVHHGIDTNRIMLVPDAMPVPAPPRPERRFEGPPTFLWVGRFYPGKCCEMAVRAARRVAEILPGSRFVFVGEGVLLERAKQFAEGAPEGAIEFTGHIHDPAELARRRDEADIYFFTTVHEAFGRALGEALADGIPSIATDIPVLREVMGDAGDLFPLEDEDGLVEALLRLARDPERRRQLAAAGPAHMKAKYSEESVAQALLTAYASAA